MIYRKEEYDDCFKREIAKPEILSEGDEFDMNY
jgi:hypothetical protein